MPTQQIKQRKQKYPHDIDEMPIEPDQLDRRIVTEEKRPRRGLDDQSSQQANPMIMCNACIPVMAK